MARKTLEQQRAELAAARAQTAARTAEHAAFMEGHHARVAAMQHELGQHAQIRHLEGQIAEHQARTRAIDRQLAAQDRAADRTTGGSRMADDGYEHVRAAARAAAASDAAAASANERARTALRAGDTAAHARHSAEARQHTAESQRHAGAATGRRADGQVLTAGPTAQAHHAAYSAAYHQAAAGQHPTGSPAFRRHMDTAVSYEHTFARARVAGAAYVATTESAARTMMNAPAARQQAVQGQVASHNRAVEHAQHASAATNHARLSSEAAARGDHAAARHHEEMANHHDALQSGDHASAARHLAVARQHGAGGSPHDQHMARAHAGEQAKHGPIQHGKKGGSFYVSAGGRKVYVGSKGAK